MNLTAKYLAVRKAKKKILESVTVAFFNTVTCPLSLIMDQIITEIFYFIQE